MVKRIVIYGWVIPVDRIYGPGSGALVDLIYFVDDEVSISDVIGIIQHAGFKIIPKRYPSSEGPDGRAIKGPVEQDKVQIEEWENRISRNVTVGSEQVPGSPTDRYSYPTRDI